MGAKHTGSPHADPRTEAVPTPAQTFSVLIITAMTSWQATLRFAVTCGALSLPLAVYLKLR